MQLRYITKTGNARTATSLESETLFSLLFCFSALWLVSRLRLHEAKVIKDRRHHLRTYPNCFVAKELIDWLIEHKEASERDTAIKIMQKLLDQSIIHHGKAGLQQQASFFLSLLTFSGNDQWPLKDGSSCLRANLAHYLCHV